MTVVTFFVILDASGAGPVCFVPDRPIDERNRATSQNQGTGTAAASLAPPWSTTASGHWWESFWAIRRR